MLNQGGERTSLVKPHLKNTQMTLEYQIFDEKALE